jgi:Ulp1 family protease
MLVYPPNGVGSVNITRGDYKRLDPGEFFNDTLIEYGLK